MADVSVQKDFMAFVSNPKDEQSLRQVFQQYTGTLSEVVSGGLKDAIKYLSKSRSPKVLIVDIAGISMPLSVMNELSDVCEPGVKVIVVGEKNDVGLYRELMKLGISDYIVAPILPEIVSRALDSIVHGGQENQKTKTRKGKIISIVGASGGVGVSTIAASLGHVLSQEKSRRVAIVDMNIHAGVIALLYDLKPNHGLREALENPDRIDEIFLERLMLPVDERLQILSSEEAFGEYPQITMDGVDELFEHLADRYHYVLVDMPRFFTRVTNAIVENSNMMIVVSNSSVSSVRDCVRYKQLFGSEGSGRRVIYAVNKRGEYREGELSQDYFERFLDRPADHFIPFDPIMPLKAFNKGQIRLDEKSPLWVGIERIVDDVVGEKSEEEKQGIFSQIKMMIGLK